MLERIQHVIELEGITPAEDQPLMVAWRNGQIEVTAEVCAYDGLGVSVHALTVQGDRSDVPLEGLATIISERVTYLWESLALIELDREQVQMRSAPPLAEGKTIAFYEGQLTRQAGSSRLHLIRCRHQTGEARRTRIPITLTHETFRRLVNDLGTILQMPESE